MANQLGTSTANASPREYDKHERHTNDARRQASGQRGAFLNAQATRLSSTEAVIASKLLKYSARQIVAASSIGDLS